MESPTAGSMSTYQFFNRFPDEPAARAHVERLRWGDAPMCVHCGGERIAFVKDETPLPYRCKDCRKFFSVKTGTLFHSANVGLREILFAIYLMTVAKKGMSSCELARILGVTQKTAWYLEHRIREALDTDPAVFGGVVEVDETYFGGKDRNRHASKREHKGRGPVGKQAVVGMLNRDTGTVTAEPIGSTNTAALQGYVESRVERGATVYTDGHAAYVGLKVARHEAVAHSIGEYVRGMAHTNGIESFWSLLKRGYIGTFHWMSEKHLGRYVNEFAVRHNRRAWTTAVTMNETMRGSFSRTLGWKRLTA